MPIVESDRIASEMPFSDDSRRISRRLQQLGEGRLRTVKDAVAVIIESILVRILAGHDRGATGTADRVRYQTAIKTDSFTGDPIHMGSVEQLTRIAIATDGLASKVVGEEKNDVRPLGVGGMGRVNGIKAIRQATPNQWGKRRDIR